PYMAASPSPLREGHRDTTPGADTPRQRNAEGARYDSGSSLPQGNGRRTCRPLRENSASAPGGVVACCGRPRGGRRYIRLWLGVTRCLPLCQVENVIVNPCPSQNLL